MQAAESSVNLERYCDEGFPDPESIEFERDDVFQEAGVCSVRVSCTFTETVQTGCSDVALGHPAAVKFDVILDLESDTVVFDYVDCTLGYDD